MPRIWVEFHQGARRGLIGTHRWWSGEFGTRGMSALPPEEWNPPIRPIPGKGYPTIHVEAGDVVLEFISPLEMLDMAEVLERPNIDPETSERRWYRKLPARLKSSHARRRTAALLRKAAAAYEAHADEIARIPTALPGSAGASGLEIEIRP